jgi:PAS domain S-box-containing protein
VYAQSPDNYAGVSRPISVTDPRYHSTIIENIPDIVVTTDLDYRIRSWNKKSEEVFGFLQQEAIGKLFHDLIHFDFLETTLMEAFIELEQKGIWRGEVAYTHQQGKVSYFQYTVSFLLDKQGNKTGVYAIGHEISRQKRSTEKLKESEKFYRSLVRDSLDGILLMDANGIVTYVSPSVRLILGFDPAEAIGMNGFEFVHPEDRMLALQSFEKERYDSSTEKHIVIRLLKKGGEWLWCMVRAHNLLSNPSVNGIAIYFHDDTLRKTASEALKESEQRFRNLVSELQVGILLQDPEGNIMMSNQAMYNMMYVTEREIIGQKVWNIFPNAIHEDERPFVFEERPSYKAIHTKKPVAGVVMGVLLPAAKKTVWLLINAYPVLDAEGSVQSIICSFTDITERKKLEQKLLSEQLGHQRQLTQATIDSQEKERREIGKELHDNIGQQLTTIKLYLELAQSSADPVTAEMISLSQRNISDVINDIRSICRALIPSSLGDLGLIECINDLIISVSRAQKLQFNLCHSYFDEEKVPENQKLMLFRIIQEQLNNIIKHASARSVTIYLQNDLDELVLEIRDDGKGFDTSAAKRGLGLTNMKNRVETFSGSFNLISSIGKGTSLKIAVPFSCELPT